MLLSMNFLSHDRLPGLAVRQLFADLASCFPLRWYIIIIIIIIISIFKEDNVCSIIASLPYGPPMNTDIDYYRT